MRRGMVGALTLALVAMGCSMSNALVGGSCATGYTDCGGVCVALLSDADDCGACGVVCASGQCLEGACMMTPDGAPEGGADARGRPAKTVVSDGGGHDGDRRSDAATYHDAAAPVSDGTAADGTARDGKASVEVDGGAESGARSDGSRAAEAGRDDAHGLDGGHPDVVDDATKKPAVDAQAKDADAPEVLTCSSPDKACGAACVDESNDPSNCGRCGHTCASGICTSGACTGSMSGDIVVVGHDYATVDVRTSAASILSNAVFLPPSNPLYVLAFSGYADASQMANVSSALNAAASALGRTVVVTRETDGSSVPSELVAGGYDVLLVFDQPDAPANTLGALGTSWSSSLQPFLSGGGDVVVLDGHSGAHPQMASFLTEAGLLAVRGEAVVAAGTELLVVASGDAVGNSVVSPYASQLDTVSFVTSEPNGGAVTYVVDETTDGGLVPVVIHKTVSGP